MNNYKRFSFRFNQLKKGNKGTKLDVTRILLKDFDFMVKEANQLVDYPKKSAKSSFEDFVELLEFVKILRR